MSVFFKDIELNTISDRPSYHQITPEVQKAVDESAIINGICLVQTAHTTCSIYFDEYMHDTNYYGDDFLQIDLNHTFDKIIPRQTTENHPYLSPGPKHIAYGMKKTDPNYPAKEWTMLNTDGHLRADFLGNSVSLGIKNAQLMTGSVGSIFFVDFDQTRERNRKVNIIILGE
ncbi:MAG: YjbQ family protein [Lactobacillus sp.]|jgi:thiamine phosphate synthase YjbQ (UPF0047 family)|nr:YjbQ family protein [Lactobacillus sp.]